MFRLQNLRAGSGRMTLTTFGDILSQWDQIQHTKPASKKQTQVSHKKANASFMEQEETKLPEEKNTREAMTAWLNRYGTVDKDKLVQEHTLQQKMNDREYLRTMKPEATIDLHGLTRDEAWNRLDAFVGDCKRRGLKKILVIHGKGNHSHGTDPVLGPMVRLFIEKDSRMGSSGHPDRNNGGTGATWVIIK